MDLNASSSHTSSQLLVDVAMGREPADLVVRGGRWVSVQSGEILDSTDISIKNERIAYVGEDAAHTTGDATQIIEADGRYLVPGLLDGHTHIESGMITMSQFVRAVLPHGTTGMFVDPHEIANVFGLKGIRIMVDEAAVQPIHVWVQVPSSVPSAPGLETAGAVIGPKDVEEALTWPGVIGLGEMMNFPGVIASDSEVHAEMDLARTARRVIGGHYASADLGLPFHGYAAGGPEDDHEGTRMEDAMARVRQGMKVMMRFGSAWHDVAEQVRAVTENSLDPRHFILVTDDIHSGTLVNEGHMDRVVRHGIEQGLDPMTALQMATLNTAEHFGVATQVGQIAPGRFADILLVDDLEMVKIHTVIAKGVVAVNQGEMKVVTPEFEYSSEVRASVRLARKLTPDDFLISVGGNDPVQVNVIGLIENQAPTRHLRVEMRPSDGELRTDLERDVVKVALVERHRGTGEIQMGFVQGFGLMAQCAVASTVAHDSHHMLVVGTDESSMAAAANALDEVEGGIVAVREGEVIAIVELPIAGLMSDEPAEVVAEKADRLLTAFRECGSTLNSPNMQLSLLALVVIPELRISDKGIVDATKFEIIPLIEEQS